MVNIDLSPCSWLWVWLWWLRGVFGCVWLWESGMHVEGTGIHVEGPGIHVEGVLAMWRLQCGVIVESMRVLWRLLHAMIHSIVGVESLKCCGSITLRRFANISDGCPAVNTWCSVVEGFVSVPRRRQCSLTTNVYHFQALRSLPLATAHTQGRVCPWRRESP